MTRRRRLRQRMRQEHLPLTLPLSMGERFDLQDRASERQISDEDLALWLLRAGFYALFESPMGWPYEIVGQPENLKPKFLARIRAWAEGRSDDGPTALSGAADVSAEETVQEPGGSGSRPESDPKEES